MFPESKFETRNSKLGVGSLSAGEFRVSSFQFPASSFQFPISGFRKLGLALLTTSGVLTDATMLQAQSCAMCYNTAAAAKAAAIQALRSGILILLIPVALMFIGIFVLAFRSKERFNEPSPEQIDYDGESSNWLESLRPGDSYPQSSAPEDVGTTLVVAHRQAQDLPQRRARAGSRQGLVPGTRTQP
jgi:hypothetical protein